MAGAGSGAVARGAAGEPAGWRGAWPRHSFGGVRDPTETARLFAGELAAALREELRSVLLYGSVPRGEAIPGVSDINVLVLVDRVRLPLLRRVSGLARRWTEAGNTAPLFLGWHDWEHSADAFAVEVADMQRWHEVLRGEDPLADLPLVHAALRHQLEHELRGKMVQLHEGLMLVAEEPEEVGRLLLAALPSFTTYLRAALTLADRPISPSTEAMVPEAAALVSGDPDAFLVCWRARCERRSPRVGLKDSLVEGYYRLVERTVAWVDGLLDR